MGRYKRIVIPGVVHHVTTRGNNRQDVFFTNEDRETYLADLKFYCAHFGAELLAYCLMSNHTHHAIVPSKEETLAKVFHAINMRHAQRINDSLARTGHIWEGQFFSSPMDEEHLWTAIRYIELNPVRAGISQKAEEYQWSSARAHCFNTPDPLLTTDPTWANSKKDIGNWGKWLSEGHGDVHVWSKISMLTLKNRPSASSSSLKNWSERLGKAIVIPKRGRPRK